MVMALDKTFNGYFRVQTYERFRVLDGTFFYTLGEKMDWHPIQGLWINYCNTTVYIKWLKLQLDAVLLRQKKSETAGKKSL